MPTAVSSEFIALCRAQLQLLAEGLGASRSIVYLTEALENGGTSSKLMPAIVYPETEHTRSKVTAQVPLAGDLLPSEPAPVSADTAQIVAVAPAQSPLDRHELQLNDRQDRLQIVLPLVYNGAIVGLLMTSRDVHPWSATERSQIHQVAQTIAIAGGIDLRRNWLTIELQHQQQLQRQQQALLHNLLHQLRNPLTAIRTFGKLLIKRLQPEDANRSTANSIVRESDRLQELLQHLEVAIEIDPPLPAPVRQLAGDAESPTTASANLLLPAAAFRSESCRLSDVLDPLIVTAEAIAQARNLTFHAHIPTDLPLLQAPPAALREVLSNLLDNALKYTPAGGEVDLDVETATAVGTFSETAASSLQICIRDTGLGIPPQDLDKIFTRHYRGVKAEGNIAGTGLGLAIAKELVTHMNGKITAISPPPGSDRGTEFILYLPLAAID